MKLLLYSPFFWPSVGGVETITDTLASNVVHLGHRCIVITETASSKEKQFTYQVVRRPSIKQRFQLVKECSLIHSNGASAALFPYALLNRKPFIWTHNGYLLLWNEALSGADYRVVSPTILQSFIWHFKERGFFSLAKEIFKLSIRRAVANYVDLNIAPTYWVNQKQPLKRQVVAYTPYPLNQYKPLRENEDLLPIYDFIYVGRLVKEKGVDDLIHAFRLLVSNEQFKDKTLAIVGDGPEMQTLQNRRKEFFLKDNVFFFGAKTGKELINIIGQANIGVVPSIYEEPMGGVALELLAAGKNIIVSRNGGHAECVGGAGLKFENGNYQSLYECMRHILTNKMLAQRQLEIAQMRIEDFDEIKLTQRYIELYDMVMKKHI